MTFPTLQLSLAGLADKVSPLLAAFEHSVHAVEPPRRQPSRNLLMIDLFSTHDPKIYMISPIDKPLIGDIMYPSKRETDMANIKFFAEVAGQTVSFARADHRG